MTTEIDAEPGSLKIVGQGLVAEQGAGDVRLPSTSEDRKAEASSPPAIELTTIITGDRLDRTTSPHEALAPTATASAAHPMNLRAVMFVKSG
jgi:hypothetical protein